MKPSVPLNIRWLYIITFLGECYLTMAVWLFFYTKFLTYSEITMLVMMQQLVQLIFEIPTGAIADLLGKKYTLVISYVFYFVSLFLTPFFSTFWVFFALEFIKGIAKALASGTFEALTYDSLKEAGKEAEYPKVTANITSISWIAYFIAGATGGYLFDLAFKLPYLILAGFYLLAIIIFLIKIHEPKIDSEKGELSLTKYLQQLLLGFKELFATKKLGTLVVFLLTTTLGYYTASEFLGISQGQAYGLSATKVSLLFMGGYIISATLAQLFPRISKSFAAFKIALIAPIFMLLSYVFANFVSAPLGMLLIITRIGSSSTFGNARSVLLNQQISSKNRATALSTFSLLYTLPYVVVTYIGGKVIDATSANYFALIFGIFLFVLMAASLIAHRFARDVPRT